MNNNHLLSFSLIILCGVLIYISIKNSQDIKELQAQLEILTAQSPDAGADLPENIQKPLEDITSIVGTAASGLSKAFDELLKDSDIGKETPRICVNSSYRIEDRYVSYKVHKPELLGDKEGTVIVNIIVNRSGDVTKTSINKASTITDEDVIDSARKAALQTDFNFNYDAPEKQAGIIKYTYKKQ